MIKISKGNKSIILLVTIYDFSYSENYRVRKVDIIHYIDYYKRIYQNFLEYH